MKKIIYLIPLLFLMACVSPIIEKVVETYPDNAKKTVTFHQDKDGKQVLVEEKHFYQNGTLKMGGKFVNGKREGEWKAFFENEQIQSLGTFKDGLRTGGAKIYYPNGNIRYEGFYEKDKEVGHWKFYTEAGKLTKEEDF
jgi:antitoxin component YwqK of YwqJK toxin-antitoxin module